MKILMALLTALVLPLCGTGMAGDRQELNKIIETIPQNGPFWEYGNIVMRRNSRKAGMLPVVFSHWSHRTQYTCRVCHQELGFSMRSDDTGITRREYLAGKFCGACHDGKTAFTVQGDRGAATCKNCHMENTNKLRQRFQEVAASLPHSRFGNGIDWVAALNDEAITPRDSLLTPRVMAQIPNKLRAPIKLGTTSPRSDVTFPHEVHLSELDCSSCHPDIFNIKKKGTMAFTMERNIYGNFCGFCHMRVAFPLNDCKRCHPKMGTYSGF